jgi:hypothetical protein
MSRWGLLDHIIHFGKLGWTRRKKIIDQLCKWSLTIIRTQHSVLAGRQWVFIWVYTRREQYPIPQRGAKRRCSARLSIRVCSGGSDSRLRESKDIPLVMLNVTQSKKTFWKKKILHSALIGKPPGNSGELFKDNLIIINSLTATIAPQSAGSKLAGRLLSCTMVAFNTTETSQPNPSFTFRRCWSSRPVDPFKRYEVWCNWDFKLLSGHKYISWFTAVVRENVYRIHGFACISK